MTGNWQAAEERLGVAFTDRHLLARALTHSSHRGESGAERRPDTDNEQLEFLGDAVLGLLVSEHVVRSCPELDEGRLSNVKHQLVNRGHLAEVARRLGIGELLLLGRGEEASGGRSKTSLLANALEALLGAMYLDSGIERVNGFVLAHVVADADLRAMAAVHGNNVKTTLDAMARARDLPKPEYSTVAENVDFPQSFVTALRVGEGFGAIGRGASKKAAEMEAARELLKKLDA